MSDEERQSPEEPATFSPASASLALSEMFDALPRTKRGLYLGHLNEIGMVLHNLAERAGVSRGMPGFNKPVVRD